MMASHIAVFLLLTGIVCGEMSLDELEAKISLLESNQKSLQTDYRYLQDKVQEAKELHTRDMENAQQYCEEVKTNAEEEMEELQNLQQSLLDNLPSQKNNSHPAASEGPCKGGDHTVIDDPWRSTDKELGNSAQNMCDKNLDPGWYRFLLNGNNAVIPTSCVPANHCQTHAPQWLNLREQSLPEPGMETVGLACASWDDDCCNWESPITVRNCGHYFVYKLEPRDTCNLAYCVKPQN